MRLGILELLHENHDMYDLVRDGDASPPAAEMHLFSAVRCLDTTRR